MDNDEIEKKFRKAIKYAKLSFLVSALGIVFIIYGTIYAITSGNIIIQSIGIVFFIVGIIINSIVWRCPVCRKPLPQGQSIKNIKYCSNCNAKLK